MNSDDIGAILLSLSEKGLIDKKSLFERIKHIDGVIRAVKFVTKMVYESLLNAAISGKSMLATLLMLIRFLSI